MTFDGKTEKFELFEDLFHTMIKMQPSMTEQMKINHFHSLLRKGALQTFRNINSIYRQTLEDVLVIFRRNYVRPESQATAKHKWHRLIFDPNTMKLPDFLEELNQGADKAFGENAKSMIDSLLYAKLPPKLKRSVNMARLENGTYEEIVAHLEREVELNALEESDDLPIATMASSSGKTRNLLSNGIETNKDTQCTYCKAEGRLARNSKRNGKWTLKMAQSPNVRLIQNAQTAVKPITQWKNVGVVKAHTFVPNETSKTPRTLQTQTMKEIPLKLKNQSRPHQPNRHPKRLIQRTKFATTPNTQPNVDTTLRNI